MEVLARIQGHPSRKELHGALLEALSPLEAEVRVHSSDPPDPWAGYSACLSDLPDCSHVLVVQDDALPCRNFGPAVQQVAERYPHIPVCLFLGAHPASTASQAQRAFARKRRYVPLRATNFVPLVACLWPKAKAQEFLDWAEEGHVTRADDGNAARWMRRTRQAFMVSVPSLVEHNDFVPSVKGGRQHLPGKEAWRRAVLLAEDASLYEW